MAMRKRINKEDYDKLPDLFKEMYAEKDGNYVLDLEDEEDNGALLRAKEREKEKAKEAKAKAKELEAELSKYREAESAKEEEQAKKAGDISTLEKKWDKKYEDAVTAKDQVIQSLTNKLTSVVVDSVALGIANEISTVPDLMVDVIKKRLTVDLENDTPTARVIDPDGSISAKTVDELKSEFKENSRYSSIIIGSRASGGAKPDPAPTASPAPGGSDTQTKLTPDLLLAKLRSEIPKE